MLDDNTNILLSGGVVSTGGGSGFTTDQNDELNTTGSPKFFDLEVSGDLDVNNIYYKGNIISDGLAGFSFTADGFTTEAYMTVNDGYSSDEIIYIPTDNKIIYPLGYSLCNGAVLCYTFTQLADDNPEASEVLWSDLTDQGTFTDGKYCTYASGTGYISCTSDGGSGGTPIDQGVNTTSSVRHAKIGIGTAPSYLLDIRNSTYSQLTVANIDITQTATAVAALTFKNNINTASGNPFAYVLDGALKTSKDLSGVQTMKASRIAVGSGSATQTQGTRLMYAYDVDISPAFTTGGTKESVGYEYSNAAGFFTGGTYNQYGAKFVKTDNSDFGAATINTYGLYLDNWDKGSSEDSSYAIWVDEGDVVFKDKVCLESSCTYYLEYNGTCIYSSGSGACV